MTRKQPTTKRECKELGLYTLQQWRKKYRIPRRRVAGIVVKGDRFFREDQTEELISKTEAKRRGLRPAREPVAMMYGRHMNWYVYRISDCKPRRKCIKNPPVAVDLLSAVFAVNRAAKRYRDAAQSCYQKKAHGLASTNRGKKERLYSLKERGIIAAHRLGKLVYTGTHGQLALYQGNGYCFHSPLVPCDVVIEQDQDTSPILVEKKPRGRAEPRLCDAEYTLSVLPHRRDGYRKLSIPRVDEFDDYELEYCVHPENDIWNDPNEWDEEPYPT